MNLKNLTGPTLLVLSTASGVNAGMGAGCLGLNGGLFGGVALGAIVSTIPSVAFGAGFGVPMTNLNKDSDNIEACLSKAGKQCVSNSNIAAVMNNSTRPARSPRTTSSSFSSLDHLTISLGIPDSSTTKITKQATATGQVET